MVSEGLTGTRIRERRQIIGLRQADLARQIGISPSYLNLIEHNRRRIGGKLLLKIAGELGVESALLTEGAEAALIGTLREAEADAAVKDVELDRIEEFAGRFPGWARLLAATHTRVRRLEQMVDGLNDRLTHDPELAASVHEVLSTAASIRSTASILAETDSLEREWLNRFHANINEDSARLAASSRALAGYLEHGRYGNEDAALPQEEVDELLSDRNYRFDELEDGTASAAEVAEASGLSAAARAILRPVLDGYVADVEGLPLARLEESLAAGGITDPVRLARTLEVPVPVVMRRMACLRDLGAGYVMCDRSGSLLLRKPVPGFEMPRFGSSCPLWPLFMALSQPGTVVRKQVVQLGRRQGRFDCFAAAETVGATVYNMPPLVRSGMLILPSKAPGEPELTVGASCRICPRSGCPGRREPSVLQASV
jgi:transcriptional regulator with XRE-family HTH domain